MAYDDERPPHWTTYDRVATASADLRDMLRMEGVMADLRRNIGRFNAERILEYLDCIDKNLEKMGELGLSFAMDTMKSVAADNAFILPTPPEPPIARVAELMSRKKINSAWNIAEAWANGKELPED
jgi:hypothetical protein